MYPFTNVLEVMKPCKPDKNKRSHQERLAKAMLSNDYVLEEKIDGIHGMCIGGRMFSSKLSKKTNLPTEKTTLLCHICDPLRKYSTKMILDGEIYYPGKKSNHITSITNCDLSLGIERQNTGFLSNGEPTALPICVANRKSETVHPGNLRYIVYDILRDADGTWLMNKPFIVRRAILEQRFTELDHIEELDLNAVHYDNFKERLSTILDRGGEGAVLKHKAEFYYPGKRPMWNQIKLKQEMEDDVIVIGLMPATKEYTGKNVEDWPYWIDGIPVTENYYKGNIGSIQVGKYDANGNLVPLGTLTGLTDALRADMTICPEKYINTVIKIKAMEKSEHGVYRHANFLSWHPDKNPRECKMQEND